MSAPSTPQTPPQSAKIWAYISQPQQKYAIEIILPHFEITVAELKTHVALAVLFFLKNFDSSFFKFVRISKAKIFKSQNRLLERSASR